MGIIHTPAEMRALEQRAIEAGEVTGLQLMERAGRGVVEAVFGKWPELHQGARRAVVLCGPGNNGGDGFVIARLLQGRGWTVDVLLLGSPETLPPDAQRNCDIWRANGRQIAPLTLEAAERLAGPDLAVDAMFGTGLNRAIARDCALAWRALTELDEAHMSADHEPCRRVAVDCASGLDAASGHFLVPLELSAAREDEDASQRALTCDLTVTFHSLKPCHVLGGVGGECRVVDIGLAPSRSRVSVLQLDAASAPVQSLSKSSGNSEHKFSHGHALVLSGGAGRSGAARLAARGALRIGAGLVTMGVPKEAQAEVAAQITAVMMREVGDAAQLGAVLQDARITALCIGPGLGLSRAPQLVEGAVRAEHAPYVVLDADALSAFQHAPEALFEMLHERCVLTPHGGEFARLFPDIAARLDSRPVAGPAFSKIDAVRAAAERAGCTVLFKGVDTVIAQPDGQATVHSARGDRHAPWLATAGSGDVLAGFITGLLARGFAPMRAAELACWLHVSCAKHIGAGLIAEDLPDALPKVLSELGLSPA